MTERFDKFEASLAKKLPGFQVKYKDESTFMKLIGMLMFFNKTFMTGFVTTIGYTVYLPTRAKSGSISTLAHEYRHAKDASQITRVLFGMLYLLPQLLGIPGALAALILVPLLLFGVVSWSWWLLPLMLTALFLAPLPAYFRKKYEVNGYTMSLFMTNELLKEGGFDKNARKERLTASAARYNKNFTGANYYFMWPFGVEEDLQEALDKILSEEISKEHEVYQEILDALEESKA
jgi:Zn-dependent protease with chaperone function